MKCALLGGAWEHRFVKVEREFFVRNLLATKELNLAFLHVRILELAAATNQANQFCVVVGFPGDP